MSRRWWRTVRGWRTTGGGVVSDYFKSFLSWFLHLFFTHPSFPLFLFDCAFNMAPKQKLQKKWSSFDLFGCPRPSVFCLFISQSCRPWLCVDLAGLPATGRSSNGNARSCWAELPRVPLPLLASYIGLERALKSLSKPRPLLTTSCGSNQNHDQPLIRLQCGCIAGLSINISTAGISLSSEVRKRAHCVVA